MVKPTPHTCHFCAGISFNSWEGYRAHMSHYHAYIMIAPIRPINTSGRTKAQIVAEMERTTLKDYILGEDKAAPLLVIHGPDCNCMPCFNKKLDALIAKQEAALNGGNGDA